MNHEPGRFMFAYSVLRAEFGDEFDQLTNTDAALIGRDYLDGYDDPDETDFDSREYARRIGKGNLQSYADVMRVRETQGWN